MDLIPIEDGLLVDGDDLNPIIRPDADQNFTLYLMTSITYQLRPEANALIMSPRGGAEVFTALASGIDDITVVEANPLVIEAVGELYQDPKITVIAESERSYLRNSEKRFDLIVYPLTASYHPVRSGAYSLSEDYRYTVESLQDALSKLTNDGILVLSRWIQVPPSECLRLFALTVTAVEKSGGNPRTQIVAYRGYNILTVLAKKSPFTSNEIHKVREFTADRAFDITYAYALNPQETNLYNILPESIYYQVFTELIETQPHEEFYQSYPYDVTPPTDDRPFFNHFFKWSQARQLLSEIGKTWQPFGGAGYFVILGLLGITMILSLVMIILPVFVVKFGKGEKASRIPGESRLRTLHLIYFGAIGLAYFLVEIPLFQRYILYLGHPAYALTAVLFALLFFSGLGSRWSHKIPLKYGLSLLCILLLCTPVILPYIFNLTMGFPLSMRVLITAISIAPIGFLMGIPFPSGITWFFSEKRDSISIPWVWAINGTASVISSVAAALFVLSFGFNRILLIGALCYGIALFTVAAPRGRSA